MKSYFVIDPDFSRHGPFPLDTLREWAGEGRIDDQTILQDADTREKSRARALIEFGLTNADEMSESVPAQPAQTIPAPASGGWNIGAFAFGFIWLFAMKQYKWGWMLLAYTIGASLLICSTLDDTPFNATLHAGICVVNVAILCRLAMTGDQMALRSRFRSWDESRDCQNVWALWGYFVSLLVCLPVGMSLTYYLVAVFAPGHHYYGVSFVLLLYPMWRAWDAWRDSRDVRGLAFAVIYPVSLFGGMFLVAMLGSMFRR